MNTTVDTNASTECEQTLLVQADFDGELDAGQAAALIGHRAECAHCQLVHEQLVRSRALMRAVPRYAVSSALRESVLQSLRKHGAGADGERASAQTGYGALATRTPSQRRGPSRAGWFGWGAAVAAALVAVLVVRLPRTPDVEAQLISNHLRAMQLESHLIDVVSSDHHTVKPWFAGKVDFAPVVKQIPGGDYVLKGGRVDVVADRAAAVLVYQAGRHTIDVYMWPSSVAPGGVFRSSPQDGFNLRHWEEGDLSVWCVSDMGAAELETFAERWHMAN